MEIIIVAAAILYEGKVWTLPKPNRHHDIRNYMIQNGVKPPIPSSAGGFLLSDGRFATRKAALNIARINGQVKSLIGSVLTSEELW